MAEPEMIYRITVLELLSRAGFPLSNTQIAEFFTDKKYTDYFSIQEIIHNLEDNRFIRSEKQHNLDLYSITQEGKKTLTLFHERITPAIEEDIRSYFSEHGIEMREENDVTASYDRAEGGGYALHLLVKQGPRRLMDLNLNVSTLAEAERAAYNWKAHYEDVYASLMEILIR